MDYLEKIRQSILDSMKAAEQRGTVDNTLDFLKGTGRAYTADIAGTPVDMRNMVSGALSPEGGGNPYAQAIRDVIGRPDDKYSSDYFADQLGIGGEGLAYNAGNMLGPAGIKSLFKNALSPNTMKIFAGQKAKNAPLKELETAKTMTASGADPRQIWKDTGWFQGKDGYWRWEIDDSQWENVPVFDLSVENQSLPSPYSLYNENYPSSDISIITGKLPGYSGSYNKYFDSISIDPFNTKHNQKNTLLHEYQHAVQNKEGFSSGANPKSKNSFNNWYDNLLKQKRTLENLVYVGPNPTKKYEPENIKNLNSLKEIRNILKKINSNNRKDPYNDMHYRNNLGEVEARAVEKRANYTSEQRKNIFPEDDYDVEFVLPYKFGGLASLKRRK